jgi:hypothetical protein
VISPRYARLAARLVAREWTPAVEPSGASRARAVESIAGALRAKTQRRTQRVRLAGLAVVAAAGLLGYVSVRQLARPRPAETALPVSAVAALSGSGAAVVDSAGARVQLSPAPLAQGGRLIAGATGGATVQLSTGTRLIVEHDTSLEFESAGPVERFFWAQGELQAKVRKLAPGQRFVVRTPDAEVEVRGTVFRVSIVPADADCGAGTRTRVSVDEGLVEVRGMAASNYVRAGEAWPAHCAASVSGVIASPSAPPSLAPLRRLALRPSVAAPRRLQPPAAEARPVIQEASSLTQQNELFAAASAAGRQGDSARALSSFESFVSRYPTSPLAESATVHRLRILRAMDPMAARIAAREYLSRYPGGYAKNDAEKLLLQP